MDGPDDSAACRIELDADRQSARRAREFVQETLYRWGHSRLEDEVSLAVTELVTNALIHAGSSTTVTLVDLGDGVQLRVRDDQPFPPQLQDASVDDTHGRGMMLIEALGDRWGVVPTPPGKTVWLDITRRASLESTDSDAEPRKGEMPTV